MNRGEQIHKRIEHGRNESEPFWMYAASPRRMRFKSQMTVTIDNAIVHKE